jgi:hypothetical protein
VLALLALLAGTPALALHCLFKVDHSLLLILL